MDRLLKKPRAPLKKKKRSEKGEEKKKKSKKVVRTTTTPTRKVESRQPAKCDFAPRLDVKSCATIMSRGTIRRDARKTQLFELSSNCSDLGRGQYLLFEGGSPLNPSLYSLRVEFDEPIHLIDVSLEGLNFLKTEVKVTSDEEGDNVLGRTHVPRSKNTDETHVVRVKMTTNEPVKVVYVHENDSHSEVRHRFNMSFNGHSSSECIGVSSDTTFIQNFANMFNNPFNYDLMVQGMQKEERLHCHKSVLKNASSAFYLMLTADCSEEMEKGVIDLAKVPSNDAYSYESFFHAIKYIYTNRVRTDLGANTLVELVNLGYAYDLPGLIERCTVTLIRRYITVDTVMALLLHAKSWKNNKLEEACKLFIIKNKAEVIEKADAQDLQAVDIGVFREVWKITSTSTRSEKRRLEESSQSKDVPPPPIIGLKRTKIGSSSVRITVID